MGKNNKRKFKIRAKGFTKILVGLALCSPAPICLAAGTTMLATCIPTYKDTFFIYNEEMQDEAILKENENAVALIIAGGIVALGGTFIGAFCSVGIAEKTKKVWSYRMQVNLISNCFKDGGYELVHGENKYSDKQLVIACEQFKIEIPQR